MAEVLTNAASAIVLVGGTTAPTAGTSESWTVTTNSNFPVLSGGQVERVIDVIDLGKTTSYEIMEVTANANGESASWTVTRGVENTSPRIHQANWIVVPVLTAGALGAAFDPAGAAVSDVASETSRAETAEASKLASGASATGDLSGTYPSPTVAKVLGVAAASNVVTVTSNAGTVPVTSSSNIFTNSSAASMTITMATAGAVNQQKCLVQIYDHSAVAQSIGWVNTENSTVSAPGTSNGSTTQPLSVGFIYNGQTSKWRCVGVV